MAINVLFKPKNPVVSRTGAILDKPVLLAADPAASDEAATKQYVDNYAGAGSLLLKPFIVGRYYNSPFGRTRVAGTTPRYEAWMALIFTGAQMTWDRVLMTTPADGDGNYEVGVAELTDDLIGASSWKWRSGILAVPATGDDYIEHVQTISTATNWVGVAGWRDHAAAKSQISMSSDSSYGPFGDVAGSFGSGLPGIALRSNSPQTSTLGLVQWAPFNFVPDRGTVYCPSHALRLLSVDS